MKEEKLEEIEIKNISVPNDDTGDLINALFQAGFSDEETDIILDVIEDIKTLPEGDVVIDEEIIKISDKFESLNIDLSEDDLAVIRREVLKRFL